ncbi:hypothetical protein VTJ04DRAFT_5472 [Mycothermus thermophilus]|uniref:uncharacterized protein n=1 Tax=Humicola insolens TaxID=85995 RepID=UPI003743E5BC
MAFKRPWEPERGVPGRVAILKSSQPTNLPTAPLSPHQSTPPLFSPAAIFVQVEVRIALRPSHLLPFQPTRTVTSSARFLDLLRGLSVLASQNQLHPRRQDIVPSCHWARIVQINFQVHLQHCSEITI